MIMIVLPNLYYLFLHCEFNILCVPFIYTLFVMDDADTKF